MRIGIIGSGRIGGTLGEHLAAAGHEVMFSSRHPQDLMELVRRAGDRASAGTPQQASAFGEIVVFSAPWGMREQAAAAIVDQIAGKTVIDTTNPYGENAQIIDLEPSTSSEEIAKLLPGAKVVKAFNTIFFEHLRAKSRPDFQGRLNVFIAGDDAAAKQVVKRLITDIGFAPVDTGSLAEGGRRQQPGSLLYNRPMTTAQAEEAIRNG
jgi:8-hydroxy-5-deazaflavin:NADPH oxidoreductase